jgi:protease-4
MRRIGKFLLWSFAALGFLLVAAGVAAVIFSGKQSLPDKMILSLDLTAGVVEKQKAAPFEILTGTAQPVSLRRLVEGLQAAAGDERVLGLVIRGGSGVGSMAQAQEVRDAIHAFRKSGKFAIVFADTFGIAGNATVDYYLAAAADEVWLQPSGELALTGIGLEIPHARDALEKLDIEPLIGKRHEYKGAADSMLRETMSDPVRRSLKRLVDGWLADIVDGIAADRKLDRPAVRILIDRGPYVAKEAEAAKLIDRLAYWDELESELKKRTSLSQLPWVALGEYGADLSKQKNKGRSVALITAVGTILTGTGDSFEDQVIAGDDLADTIYDAAENDTYEALLIRVDSPGGVYMAADTIWRAVEYARSKGKKVVVSMGEAAASGGYFIAMAADRIVAQPGTITGSIGVYGGKLDLSGFWRKLGIHWDEVHAGQQSTMWSMNRGYTDAARARVEKVLDAIYADFTAKAAKARKLNATEIDAAARGRIWSGRDALKAKLVDTLGGYPAALAELRKLLNLGEGERLTLIPVPPPRSKLELLGDLLAGQESFGDVFSGLFVSTKPESRLGRTVAPVLRALGDIAPPVGRLQMPPLRLKR